MDTIRDLSSISEYKPSKGDLLKLYQLAQDPSITRKQAMEIFQKSPSYFRNTYKVLKDRLIEGIPTPTNLSKGQRTGLNLEIELWKRYTAFLIVNANKRETGSKIGEELLPILEKRGYLNIALELSRRLSAKYSFLGDQKYLKYKEKVKSIKVLLMEEEQVQRLHDELLFRTRKKHPIVTDLLKELPIIEKLAATNEQYKFRLLYHTSLHTIHQLNNDIDSLIKNNKAALTYCATTKVLVPEALMAYFLSQSIPIYLHLQQFEKAEAAAQKYRDHNVKGNNNWNAALQYSAIIGFQSDMPQTAANTFLKLKSIPNLKQTKFNKARWHIIHAFLKFYHAVGKIKSCPPFKLHKFLSEIAANKNDTLMGNGYLLELIHLLILKNYRVYQQRAGNIEQYISRYLKGADNARVKYFMRMLRSVAIGNFHPVRVEAHAKKNKKKLQRTPKNLHLVDTEIVPYEKIWEMVILLLSNQNKEN